MMISWYKKSTRFLYSGVFILLLLVNKNIAQAQHMPAGFDAIEYADLLHLNFVVMNDSIIPGKVYKLAKGEYSKVFRSPEVGLYNRCEVLLRADNTAIISLRGTIGNAQSWMENFYAAMVPANGSLQLTDSTTFNYKLSETGNAMVHVGWLLGLGFLSGFIDSQMELLLSKGITNIIIAGHSQGGALAFLTSSYVWYKYHDSYPLLKIKTYASAAPKPGNLYYAYDFDRITSNGYGFRIVNTADWVPESPLSVQTTNDFNDVSVLKDGKKIIKKQKFFARLVLNHLYNKMDRVSYKTMKTYRKYLGGLVYRQASKSLPGFSEPAYSYGSNYMTAGTPIILFADEEYNAKFRFDGKNYFVHHMMNPYLYLLHKQYPQTN